MIELHNQAIGRKRQKSGIKRQISLKQTSNTIIQRPRRKNGFNYPPSKEQIFTWVTYPLAVVIFYYIVSSFTALPFRWIILSLETIFTITIICTWYIVEITDPAQEISESKCCTEIPVICFNKKKQEISQYCATCNKKVRGLDHHCVWLNTCVGAATYVPFFVLVVICFSQMILHIIALLLLIIATPLDNSKLRNNVYMDGYMMDMFYGITSIDLLFSFVMGAGSGVLMSFHIYLLLVLKGTTYDYKLKGRSLDYLDDEEVDSKEEERRRAMEEIQKEEARIRDQRQKEKQKNRKFSFEHSYRTIRSSLRRYTQGTIPSPLPIIGVIEQFPRSTIGGFTGAPNSQNNSKRSRGSNGSTIRSIAGGFLPQNIPEGRVVNFTDTLESSRGSPRTSVESEAIQRQIQSVMSLKGLGIFEFRRDSSKKPSLNPSRTSADMINDMYKEVEYASPGDEEKSETSNRSHASLLPLPLMTSPRQPKLNKSLRIPPSTNNNNSNSNNNNSIRRTIVPNKSALEGNTTNSQRVASNVNSVRASGNSQRVPGNSLRVSGSSLRVSGSSLRVSGNQPIASIVPQTMNEAVPGFTVPYAINHVIRSPSISPSVSRGANSTRITMNNNQVLRTSLGDDNCNQENSNNIPESALKEDGRN